MNNQQHQCEKSGNTLSSYKSLWRHKKTCQVQPFDNIGCKRTSDVEAETLSKNPKIQALADAIINDTTVKKMDYKLPAVDISAANEKKLPTPP